MSALIYCQGTEPVLEQQIRRWGRSHPLVPELSSSQPSPSWESLFSQLHKHRLCLSTSFGTAGVQALELQGLGEDPLTLLFIIFEAALIFALGEVQSGGVGFVKKQPW